LARVKHLPQPYRAAPSKGGRKIKKRLLLIFTGFAPFEGGGAKRGGMCFKENNFKNPQRIYP